MPKNTLQKAPLFCLPDQTGQKVCLADYLGKSVVVVYFYPKDNSSGCTTQSCGFRNAYAEFQAAGAEVIGISSDSVESHQEFAANHMLPFKLLSDADGEVRKEFKVPNTLWFIPGRVTFVIDKQGIIRYSYNSQLNFDAHAENALIIIQNL